MSKLLNLTFILILLIGCDSQKDYSKLKKENKELLNRIEELETSLALIEAEYEKLVEEKQIAEAEAMRNYHPESEAIRLLEDYYAFYNANMVYRNPNIRRVNNNTFKISLEECQKRLRDFEMYWNSSVKTLVINNDGTYQIY